MKTNSKTSTSKKSSSKSKASLKGGLSKLSKYNPLRHSPSSVFNKGLLYGSIGLVVLVLAIVGLVHLFTVKKVDTALVPSPTVSEPTRQVVHTQPYYYLYDYFPYFRRRYHDNTSTKNINYNYYNRTSTPTTPTTSVPVSTEPAITEPAMTEPEMPAQEPEMPAQEPEMPAQEPEMPAQEPEMPAQEPTMSEPEPFNMEEAFTNYMSI